MHLALAHSIDRAIYMLELLDTRLKRLLFFTVILALIAAAVAGKYWLVRPDDSLTHSLVDNIISGLIISGIVTMLFLFLSADVFKVGELKIVDPWVSNELHRRALQSSTFWYHYGHYAKWVRTEAMPVLRDRARSIVVDVQIAMLDPTDINQCDLYARYRNGERLGAKEKEWTVDDVIFEAYATILSSYIANRAVEKISVRVFLTREFSVPRFDVNSDWLIMTHTDTRVGPILFPKNSVWYNILINQFYQTTRQSKEIRFVDPPSWPANGEKVTAEHLKTLFACIGVPLPDAGANPMPNQTALLERISKDYNSRSGKYE